MVVSKDIIKAYKCVALLDVLSSIAFFTVTLSHGITAICLFLLYTERNAAVEPRDNGHFLAPI